MPVLKNELLDLLKSTDLNSEQIEIHQRRIRQWSKSSLAERTFSIIDTCRFDNDAIVDLNKLDLSDESPSGFVAFTPAAGASSRFFGTLKSTFQSPDSQQLEEIAKACQGDVPLLPQLEEVLMAAYEQQRGLTRDEILAVEQLLALPKALHPCTTDGATFLDLKILENECIEGLSGQVFVVPPDFTTEIDAAIKISNKKQIPTKTVEQGSKLSTIRFNAKIEAIVENDQPSQVPAGHGMLSQLFGDCRINPTDHSLLIRNIDNVFGAHDAALMSTSNLLKFHTELLGRIRTIRKFLADQDWQAAAEEARLLPFSKPATSSQRDTATREYLQSLADPLIHLFHTPPELLSDSSGSTDNLKKTIIRLYNRPVNTMGMVPNSGTDVGGTPSFVSINGQRVKLCIEVPHASPTDKAKFIEDPKKATHFNPVFVAAEIPDDPNYYNQFDSPFWLIAEKKYKNESVFYHESILYELLGNSLMSNAVFAAISRSNFNPHKTYLDSQGRSLKDWNL